MKPIERDEALFNKVIKGPMPKHIAIIMDGNGRWATARGMARLIGHRAGVESLDRVVESVKRLGIPYISVYAFSTENWKRPQDEVDGLMRLLIEFVDRKGEVLMRENIRFCILGDKKGLPEQVRSKVEALEALTADNKSMQLNICLNYGARQELIQAVQAVASEVLAGRLSIEQIDEAIFSEHLYTAGIPDPDLLIRSSGEFRLSNFMLWQIAYTEIYITPVFWPDFNETEILKAVDNFQKRDRRFGGLHKG